MVNNTLMKFTKSCMIKALPALSTLITRRGPPPLRSRRAQRTAPLGPGSDRFSILTSPTPVTIHSVLDSDRRRIAEYNKTSGALIREYVWNGWGPVAVIEGGVVAYVRADHIGRPVFATNATGVKVWTATYTPFGGVHTSTGTLPTARFPGQRFQSESVLHQNWMRDYDPTTGRYLQADPLGLVDGASVYEFEPDGVH